MLDGSNINAKTLTGKSVLILFHPECEHCQHEAEEIQQHTASFKNYAVYFLSSATLPEIEAFAIKYKLRGVENFHFGTTDGQYVVDAFGSIPAPSVYIYSENGTLVKKFNGQTPIEEIISAL